MLSSTCASFVVMVVDQNCFSIDFCLIAFFASLLFDNVSFLAEKNDYAESKRFCSNRLISRGRGIINNLCRPLLDP